MEHILALLIPVLALSIPAAAVVFVGMRKVLLLRIEEARARSSREPSEELQALRDEVAQLRGELEEVQERLDFTERIVIQKNDPPRIADSRETESRT